MARAHKRGACRRERGDEPDTDDRANLKGFANGGAPFIAPRQNLFVIRFAAHHAAQPTLVVKMSDTSHHGKSGFESRL